MVAFEVFINAPPEPRRKQLGKTKTFLKLDSLLPVDRDFAFIMDADVPAAKAVTAARLADREMITEAEAFDSYQGKGIENGQKSVAISVTFQPTNATLTDADIESLSSKVVKAVEKATGGQLRG